MIANRNVEFKDKLLSRTLIFSTNLISIINKLPNNHSNLTISHQVVRSGTSIGANYREACEAESAKDFIHKMSIAKKEAKETEYWFELLINTNTNFTKELESLKKENNEFIKIFSTICRKFK